MDRSENSRRPTGEQGVSPKGASLPLESVSLLRQDAHGTRPARIIWLDDEERVVKECSYVFALRLINYTLISCRNGDEALREIMHQPPDLLITDYHHPGASLEAMLLHLSERPARFPILVVSACEKPEDLKRQFSSFTFTIELLSKPFDWGDFYAAVLKHLNASNPLPGLTLDGSSLRGLNFGNT